MASPDMYSAHCGLRLLPNDFGKQLAVESEQWLLGIDADPSHLRTWLASSQQHCRLGFYFALLIEYWLRFCPALAARDVVVGRQIRKDGGRGTKGQLKFLFRSDRCSPQCVLQHWEASVKFFLHVPLGRENGSKEQPARKHEIEAEEAPGDAKEEEEEEELRALSNYVGPFLCENLAFRLTEARRKLQLGRDIAAEVFSSCPAFASDNEHLT